MRNDVILEINGFSVKNLYFNDIQRIIQRDRDEYVLLKVMRREPYYQGDAPWTILKFILPSVAYSLRGQILLLRRKNVFRICNV